MPRDTLRPSPTGDAAPQTPPAAHTRSAAHDGAWQEPDGEGGTRSARAQPEPVPHPIANGPGVRSVRWPRPSLAGTLFVLVYLVGLVAAVLVPALIVSPFADSAPEGRVLAAFACTVAGALVMVAGAAGLQSRHHDGGIITLGFAPSAALLIGGFALLGELLPR